MEHEIITILTEINPYVEISISSKLLEEEILDSLGILLLVSELEKKYKIEAPFHILKKEDFETVSSIVKLLERLL